MKHTFATFLVFFASTLFAAEPVAHSFMAADRERGHLVIVNDKGEMTWEYPVKHDLHDLHVLPNGNILTHTSNTLVVEINPKKEIVWKYESKPTGKMAVEV